MNGLSYVQILMQKQSIEMFKKTLLLLVLVFSCWLSSCRSIRQETQKTELSNTFTSEKTVSYQDTTLFVPKSETTLRIPLSSLSFKEDLNGVLKPVVFSQKNGQANVKLRIEDNSIIATATCDSLAMVAKIKRELLKENYSKISNISESKQEVKGYSFMNIITSFLLGFLAGAVTFLLLKILKKYVFTKYQI